MMKVVLHATSGFITLSYQYGVGLVIAQSYEVGVYLYQVMVLAVSGPKWVYQYQKWKFSISKSVAIWAIV